MRVRLRWIHGAGCPAPRSLNGNTWNVLKQGCLSLTVAMFLTIPAWPQQEPKDLSNKTLEDLMNIEVTAVSKKEQKLSRTASAVFVITPDDVRRSGATNMPDLLRMVPGMDVAHQLSLLGQSGGDRYDLYRGGMYSRARRTRSRADRGLRVGLAAFPDPGGLPILLTLLGSPNTVSEDLDAFEAGYRTQIRSNISLDLAAFYNRYQDLVSLEPAAPFLELNPPPPHLNVPIVFANLIHGETHGLEVAVNWKVNDRWMLSPGYAFELIHLHTDPTSHDTTSVLSGEGSTPFHQAQLRSHLVLPRRFAWDASVYFVDRLVAQDVPSYTRLDTGITWQMSDHWSFSLVGQNLLRDHHLEFNGISQSETSV